MIYAFGSISVANQLTLNPITPAEVSSGWPLSRLHEIPRLFQ